jgi:tetratricopeptide (TPR) repeat protein
MGRPSTTLEAVAAYRPSMMRSADTIPAPKQPSPTSGLHRFILQADQAIRDANPVAAANSLRLALAITPDDPVLRQRLEQTQLAADVRLKDRLLLDAQQAEKSGRFADAASLYGRAARGAESGDLYLCAAECSIRARENPRVAADFAKAGLKHSPDHAKLRLVLGRIYAEAGMTASALSELEKARRLEPDDVTIQTWLERVKKGPLA